MGRNTLVTPCAMCRKRSAMTDHIHCNHKSCYKKFILGTEKDQAWITKVHFLIKRNYELRIWSAKETLHAHENMSNNYTEKLRRYVDAEHDEDESKYNAELANEGIQMECEEAAAP